MEAPKQTVSCGVNTFPGFRSTLSMKDNWLVYCSGSSVVVQNLEDPSLTDAYRDHSAKTLCCSLSPNGQWVASADQSGILKVWALSNPNYTKLEIKIGGTARDIRWTFDSQRIVAVGESCAKVFIWDTGNSIGELSGHARNILTADFRPKRPFMIATGAEDFQVNLHNGPPFSYKTHYRNHSNFVNIVRFSPDGTKILSCGNDKKCFVVAVESLEVESVLEGHQSFIMDAVWIDESNFATCSADKSVRVWNQSGEVKVLETDEKLVGICYSGNLLGAVSSEGTIFLWEQLQDPPKIVPNNQNFVTHIAQKEDTLFTSDNSGKVVMRRNLTENSVVYKHNTQVVGICAHPSENLVASAEMGASLTVYNLNSKEVTQHSLNFEPTDLCWGRELCVLGKRKLLFFNSESEVELSTECASKLAVSEESTYIGDEQGLIHQNSTKFPKKHKSPVTAMVVQGTQLVSGDSMGKIFVWEASTQEVLLGWDYHTSIVSSLSLSQGKIVSCSLDKGIILWSVDSHVPLKKLKDTHREGVLCAVVYNQNQLVSSGRDGTLKLWEVPIN